MLHKQPLSDTSVGAQCTDTDGAMNLITLVSVLIKSKPQRFPEMEFHWNSRRHDDSHLSRMQKLSPVA